MIKIGFVLLFLRKNFSMLPSHKKIIVLIQVIFYFGSLFVKADNSTSEPPEKFHAPTDSTNIEFLSSFQSRHIWRGTLTCDAWNVQPTLSYSRKNFLIGAWAAYTINNSYAEVDLYCSYSFKNFSITLLDYFCPNEDRRFNRFFDLNQTTTQHTLDVVFSFNGTERFPLQLTISTLVYGDDLNPLTSENYFSTYIEANYTWLNSSSKRFDTFLGITPREGYYASDLNIVNCGLSFSRTIISNRIFNLPIFGKLILNPYTENLFFVFGFSVET